MDSEIKNTQNVWKVFKCVGGGLNKIVYHVVLVFYIFILFEFRSSIEIKVL